MSILVSLKMLVGIQRGALPHWEDEAWFCGGLGCPGWYTLRNCSCIHVVVAVHSPSHIQLYAIPWTVARQALLSLTISQRFPEFMSVASVVFVYMGPFN